MNDYPGFCRNRVLMPMINEAIFCVMEGVATPEAIDTVMKLGMAHPMGPLALADFIGLDVCLAILEVLHKGLGRRQVPSLPAARRWWRRAAGPEERPRLLRVREVTVIDRRPDLPGRRLHRHLPGSSDGPLQ